MNMASCQSGAESTEIATVFHVAGEPVVGVFHDTGQCGNTGVLFIVGGRQYRAGAQRQYVQLARHLAANAYPSFRFDIRGMGDSAAEPLHFLDSSEDISSAVAEFRRLAPQLERVLLWGLCDGASAAILYTANHVADTVAVAGVMMVNPWITTQSGAARAVLKHYYWTRLISAGFWRKLLAGDVNPVHSLRSLGQIFRHGIGKPDDATEPAVPLPAIVFEAIDRFVGGVSVIISSRDLTAMEFKDEHDRRNAQSDAVLAKLTLINVDADHTFSTPEQHLALERLTLEWCRSFESWGTQKP